MSRSESRRFNFFIKNSPRVRSVNQSINQSVNVFVNHRSIKIFINASKIQLLIWLIKQSINQGTEKTNRLFYLGFHSTKTNSWFASKFDAFNVSGSKDINQARTLLVRRSCINAVNVREENQQICVHFNCKQCCQAVVILQADDLEGRCAAKWFIAWASA